MSIQSTNMGLTQWNVGTDLFNYSQLSENFRLIDEHDHSSTKGVQINGATGIQTASISSNQLATDAVATSNIQSNAVTAVKINTGAVTKDKIDFSSFSGLTTSLSATGHSVGDIIYYTDNATSGGSPSYIWQLRYTSIGSSSYRWQFVGGTPIVKTYDPNTAVAISSSSYTEVSSFPSVPSLVQGQYMVTFGATLNLYVYPLQATTLGYFGIGTTTSAIIDEVVYSLPKLGTSSDPSTTAYTNSGTSLSRTTSYTPSTTSTIKPYIKASGTGPTANAGSVANRFFINVMPVYLTPTA
jgi:hypothetical protein